GLVASLETYFSQIKKISLLDIHFQLIGDLPGLSDEFQLNMYRIIQELINNLLKHTDAKNALIQFHVHNDWLTVTIDNDGSPLRNNNISDIQTGSGIGLNNLHERIRLLQGTLEMEQEGNTSVYMEFNLRKFISKK